MALDFNTLSLSPLLQRKFVANITFSVNAELLYIERQLNMVVHNLEESCATEGPSKNENDVTKS